MSIFIYQEKLIPWTFLIGDSRASVVQFFRNFLSTDSEQHN